MTVRQLSAKLFIAILLFLLPTGIQAQDSPKYGEDYVFIENAVNQFREFIQDVDTSLSDADIVKSFTNTHPAIIKSEDVKAYINANDDTVREQLKWNAQLEWDTVFAKIIKQKREEIPDNTPEPQPQSKWMSWLSKAWMWIVAAILLFGMLALTRRKKNDNPVTKPTHPTDQGNSDIVVIRKTTRILRKQSLEDVIDNENYMVINCADFCEHSAVKRMYIKNTCIKDIYNLYADDLRNPAKPKEDGCMVLGRWVHDTENNEYYISLEYMVKPGDDASFKEYSLDLGAKVRFNVTTKLRKLRTETELQYDLTCWIHSHPGLGVFFSNDDYNVHMQYKHPTHPNFLTAIVVDILTPEQELGIFTFKGNQAAADESPINSKADLKKMYSLEEWYQWAVDSEKNAFNPEDYYNTLANAKGHIENCHGIQLSYSSIIDMTLMVTEQKEGFAASVHGFAKGDPKDYITTKVAGDTIPANDQIGCFIIASHCSIPSIRKTLANQLGSMAFVMVYSTSDGMLTSIPIIGNDLCADQNFYGEQQLEELKIWTRRKR